MTPDVFAAWLEAMQERGWSQRRCAAELGTWPKQIRLWRARGAPQYVGLACEALARGLTVWTPA
jgi:hypothetical protein